MLNACSYSHLRLLKTNRFLTFAVSPNRHGLAIRPIAGRRPNSIYIRIDLPCDIGRFTHQSRTKPQEGTGV